MCRTTCAQHESHLRRGAEIQSEPGPRCWLLPWSGLTASIRDRSAGPVCRFSVGAPLAILRSRDEPTVFREGPFRFFFLSREEERLHIHVQSAEGEAKFWIDPTIELARNYGLSPQDLRRVKRVIEEREQEIRDAWSTHFGS
jgi:Domain of unknown function (DUF4160)